MLISIMSKMSEPVATAALSGAMIYTLAQHSFRGINRIIAFLISFIMGVSGSDTTVNLIKEYAPFSVDLDVSTGAFLCSATIVTITMRFIDYFEKMTIGEAKKDG